MLAAVAMLAAVVAAVLYLRVVVAMYMADTDVAVAHAMTDTSDAEDAAAEDLSAAEAEDAANADGLLDLPARLPRPAVLAIFIAVVATIVLGTLPWVGQGVLRGAAADLVLLR